MIKIENLSKSYKLDNGEEVSALKNINLNVKDGEILGIIGVSGSGKTTLLRILRGVEEFDDGIVTVAGIELKPDTSKYYFNEVKTKTAIHLQRSFGLWPETALENVLRKLYGAKYGDEANIDFEMAYSTFEDEAMRLLELVGLEHKAKHYAPVLSGGEKQRLIIARQLAKKPKVMLLDEPATMACPKTKQEILTAVKNINKELGVTIVLVSHLPEIQSYLADRLILMDNGEIKKEGNPDEVISEFLKDIEDEIPLETDDIQNNEEIIKAIDLNKKFFLLNGGDVLNIKDISFEVKDKDILSLVGSSGAGKTILLRLLAGLEDSDSGNVYYKLRDNDSINSFNENKDRYKSKFSSIDENGDIWIDIAKPSLNRMDIRRNLGFMHQEFALSHYATLRDQLAVKLGFKNQYVIDDAKKRAKELDLSDELLDSFYQLTDLPEIEARSRLEKIGLDTDILDELFPKFPETAVKEEIAPIFDALDLPLEIINRRSYELSGGQKVRAILALALCSKPEILILDEPFGDLDPLTLRIVANSIKKINKELGTTIVMVSHNIDFIKELTKTAILIDNGELLDKGNPDKILKEFMNQCNAEYLSNLQI
ncbi:MAG: ATP-binding cassette domain-containing protein [Methanobrevibacter sp.]|jgi:methyl coenzyme M reductase system subunit A2|nr:ATP-binding cassette domain-containing protein [Candidatus Methanoflexus mossambicus]